MLQGYDRVVNLHVMHAARTIASITGVTEPPCQALACRLGAPDQVAAAWTPDNPLEPGWLGCTDVPAPRLLCWSGSLAPDPFTVHPPNWMRPGRAALDALMRAVAPGLEAAGRSLCLRPHVRHVLSDPQGCLRFLGDHAGLPVQVAISPSDMLTPEMLGDLPEHLTRIFASMGPRAALVLLQDVGEPDGQDLLAPVPLGKGRLPRDLVRSLLAEHVHPETPVVIWPTDVAGQLTWLRD
jgi:hypothetical protein